MSHAHFAEPISDCHFLYSDVSNSPFLLSQLRAVQNLLLHPQHHQVGPVYLSGGLKVRFLLHGYGRLYWIQWCMTRADDWTYAKDCLPSVKSIVNYVNIKSFKTNSFLLMAEL